MRLLRDQSVTAVLDVGANIGQYARELRESGYRGRIISFEPLREAFDELVQAADGDPAWDCFNLALGDTDGLLPMHVAGNLQSSSFLPMFERHVQAAPESAYTKVEPVRTTRLDAFADGGDLIEHRLSLKMDVQGYESRVLAGATGVLASVALVELELSLVELYEGQEVLPEMMKRLEVMGFGPVWLERGFADPRSGHLLQVNGFFIRGG